MHGNAQRLRLRLVMVAVAVVAAAASQPVQGQSAAQDLVMGWTPDPVTLDNRFTPSVSGQAISFHITEPLVFRDDKMRIVPHLAESWEILRSNLIRFRLRKGVKFHNGEDFNGESVRYTIQDTIRPESRTWMKSMLAPVSQVVVADPHTVLIETSKPYRPLLSNLALPGMLPPRAAREMGTRLAGNMIGTGPFRLVEYVPGQRVVVEANANYWGPKAKLRRLTWRIIPENATRVAALETGEVMFINNVPPDQIPRLSQNPDIKVMATPSVRTIYIGMRVGRKPFNDPRVRMALNYAINREEIIKTIFRGQAGIARAPVPHTINYARRDLGPWPYDPGRAKALLAEAGYARGLELTFGAPSGRFIQDRQVAEAVVGYLQAVGVRVRLEILEWGVLRPEIYRGKDSRLDLYFTGWGVTTADPDYAMTDHFHSRWSSSTTMYVNGEVDRLLDEGVVTFDEDKVRQIYRRAQELIWKDAPWIWLYDQPEIVAINKRLRNVAPRSDEFLLFWQASVAPR